MTQKVAHSSISASTKSSRTNWGSLGFWRSKKWSDIKDIFRPGAEYITPSLQEIFKPLMMTPLHKVRVMFVFPAPYAKAGIADGLALSWKRNDINVDLGTSPFPFYALVKELRRTHSMKEPKHGNLDRWAKQGVLLWNNQLTTVKSHTMAHIGLGWQVLTREVIETVYLQNPKCVFVFFGPMQAVRNDLPPDAFVYELPFPAPSLKPEEVSNIHRSGIFKQIDDVLRKNGKGKIDWAI